MEGETTTAMATPNIALIKYWGRRNEKLNLPNNSSLSMTLSEELNTRTSVVFSKSFSEDRLYIDGMQHDMDETGSEKDRYIQNIINMMRGMAGVSEHALIASRNYFPASTGLASSASGAAALIYALSSSLGVCPSKREQSMIARQISGSACRSCYGGMVLWNRGMKSDGTDSYAEQLFSENYWPELVNMIEIVSTDKKKVSSSEGHTRTVQTSKLYQLLPEISESNVVIASEAIRKKDFDVLAEIIMKSSNSMHAVMLDSYPPLRYLNDASNAIIDAVHNINEAEGKNIVAYTFDAGPNAHVITLEKYTARMKEELSRIPGISETIIAKQGSGPKVLGAERSLIADDFKVVGL